MKLLWFKSCIMMYCRSKVFEVLAVTIIQVLGIYLSDRQVLCWCFGFWF